MTVFPLQNKENWPVCSDQVSVTALQDLLNISLNAIVWLNWNLTVRTWRAQFRFLKVGI